MVNVIFNDFSYEITPKRKEMFDKYCGILQWGRRHPTRFIERFLGISLTDMQKAVLLNSWTPAVVVWLMSRNSGKLNVLSEKVPIFDGKEIKMALFSELKVGDYVIGSEGPTKVIHLNNIVIEDVWKVELENGTIVRCGGEHEWPVYDSISKKFAPNTETQYISTFSLFTQEGENRFFVLNKDQELIGIKSIVNTKRKEAMRCITVENPDGRYLIGNYENSVYTHNSFLTTPFIMSKALLFPNHQTYIMGPTGGQAQMTFTKLEDLAKGNIASVLGTTTVFLDEVLKANAKDTGFSHEKNAYHVGLYNGSEITSLSGVAKNIVGVRFLFVNGRNRVFQSKKVKKKKL